MHFLIVRKKANSVPDARYTLLVLYSLGLFHRITGDDSFIGPDKKAMKCMVETWDILAEKKIILHVFYITKTLYNGMFYDCEKKLKNTIWRRI